MCEAGFRLGLRCQGFRLEGLRAQDSGILGGLRFRVFSC